MPTGNAALPSIIKLNFEIELFRLFVFPIFLRMFMIVHALELDTKRYRDLVVHAFVGPSYTGLHLSSKG